MTIRTYQNNTPQLGARVYVDPTALVLGKVNIGADSSVWPMAVVRGDMHAISIGERCSIQDNSVLHITHDSRFAPNGFPLILGDDVTVGHRVVLHGCTVGNLCLIGIGTVVMDGAVIESQVIVGAGSLVPPGKILESGYLYLGNPCKKIRLLTQQELDFLPYTAANYVKLKDSYLSEPPQI